MIKKVLEYGSTSGSGSSLLLFNIELRWGNEVEYTEVFTGADQKEVKQRAMEFILNHYKALN